MKSLSLRLSIAVIAILAISLACSMPFVISPVEPEEKIVYVEITSTPAPQEPTAAPPAAATEPAATPSVAVSLDGEWTIWQGSDEKELDIDFLQDGYSIIANTATGDGGSLLFKGVISQDSKSASGTWESTKGTSGNFVMLLDASNTAFSGSLGSGVPFCGSRSGIKPSPCMK